MNLTDSYRTEIIVGRGNDPGGKDFMMRYPEWKSYEERAAH
jgi:hypothetical protein